MSPPCPCPWSRRRESRTERRGLQAAERRTRTPVRARPLAALVRAAEAGDGPALTVRPARLFGAAGQPVGSRELFGPPARRRLIGVRLARRAAAAKHRVEQLRHLLGFAVAHLVDMHAGARDPAAVEPFDPTLRRRQQSRPRGDDEDGVLRRDVLKLDEAVAQARFARIHDLFEFGGDDRGIIVTDGKQPHRLPAHPVDVELSHGVDGVATLVARADDEQKLARRIRAHRAGPGRKPFQQLGDGRRRHVMHGNDGHAIARRRSFGGIGAVGGPEGAAFGERSDAIAARLLDQRQIVGAQPALQHEQQIFLGDRAARRKIDRSLRARVDRVALTEQIAEHHLGDVGHRAVFEVERVAVGGTSPGRLRRRRAPLRPFRRRDWRQPNSREPAARG